MKISVIIPCYNSSKYIEKCILSVLNQTYKNIEIIVIDDGSSDNTRELIKKYDVISIFKENGGVSSARNMGLKIASGEYITFIDSDDYVSSNYIESIVNIINDYSYDIIETPLLFEFYKKNKLLTYTEYKLKSDRKSLNFSKEYFNNELRYVIGVFYKKDIISDINFDEDILCYEDNMFNLKVKFNSKSYYFYPKCFYHYVQNLSSLSKTISLKHLDYILVMERLNDYLKDKEYKKDYIENIYLNNILSIILFKLPYFKQNKYKYRKDLIRSLKNNTDNISKKHRVLIFILNGYILISIWFFIIRFININKLVIKFQSKNKYDA